MSVEILKGRSRVIRRSVRLAVHASCVRNREMWFTDPPWVHDLVGALRAIGAGPREVLPLASALEELLAVADGSVKGRSPGSPGDIHSLRKDIQAAVAAAGPALSRRLGSLEIPLRREVGRLTELLKDPAVAALPTVTARAALRLLSEPAAAADAWDDLVEAWSNGATLAECGQRQAILEDLLERAGLRPEWDLDLARDVLMNRGWGLLLTGVVLDEPFEKDAQGYEIALELPARLARIRRFLLAALAWHTRTVWFAFTGAALEGRTVRVGPVQFFSADILDAPAGEEVPPELRRLEELAADDEDEGPSSDPFEEVPREDVVLARVDVGKHWPDRSPDFARRLVACVVALARPEYGWQMAPGDVTLEDGVAERGDLVDGEWEQGLRPAPDLTAALESLPAIVFERLVEGVPAALELEQSVTWAAAVAKLPNSAQRVALGLRALEQALPPDPSARGWPTAPAVQRFLFTPWRDRRMIDDARLVLEEVIVQARVDVTGALRSRLQQIGHSDPTVLDLVAEALPQLAEQLPAATPWRAESERLLALQGAERKAWSATLEDTFETLLARAVRVRNAVLHGGAVQAASLESVDGFVAHLTQIINDHRVLALTESSSLLDVLEHVRVSSRLGAPPSDHVG